ncbi:MAG: 50S ribosomal protein L1 [Candidatus Kerfeldbacteria bacterium CG_4_10_14_0_8_um_filter_42_10]|uniref:Large ribosomal subunit protein uL1 n=1 Tax=Candidatus Kerfeldbacteria bacterium CG_4_10_14_0_8_um_filter_42_10 TaxID=2014248 RepID=A0A2M7RKL0_9BACT|nr:MAG: 50S ribosomal protein L1 [Candidatus Kerfeldbacteria bacterium CG_4_10_14_0_8_um_filter_42_10]
MTKRSKRYREALGKIDKAKLYPIDEAIQLVKDTAKTKFDSSVEVHIKLGIDTKKADQLVRGTVLLPYGLGKERRLIAFVMPAKEKEAKEAGADIIGDDAMIKKIKETKKCDFDIAVAEPALMKNLSQVAKILGQKGLMPNPKTETISPDISKIIKELKGGKGMFRSDDSGNLHQMIGKASFDNLKLKENYQAFLDAVKKSKPEGVKGTYILSLHLSSSMSPSVKIKI